MKQHQSDRHQVTLLLDETRQQIACFHSCHTKKYRTSIAQTLSIMSSSLSLASDELLEAERTNAKFNVFNALRTRVWCH